MDWIELSAASQLDDLKAASFHRPQVIFKHSTRCNISSMVKSRLDRATAPAGVDFFYLDLIRYRQLSNQIADDFAVWHESPQIILLVNGKSIYDESHTAISIDALEERFPK